MNLTYFIVGLLFVTLTVIGVLFILVLPRRPFGIERLSLVVNNAVRLLMVALSHLFRRYETKDALLATVAPIALLMQLLTWAMGLVIGFALMLMPTTHSFLHGITQSSTALFTVGAIHSGGPANIAIDIADGATWVVIVALQIAYLPSLYAAFNRREGLVTLLEGRAGSPAWGPELLARHQLVNITDTLPAMYAAWEIWAADVTESHTTYPVLLLFRSPEPWLSWVIGMLAVLDAGALQLALSPSTAPSEARLCMHMGFTMFNRIASSLGWRVANDPTPDDPISLSYAEYERAVAMLSEVGFPMERTAEEAWPHFHGWRVNYEESAYHLANFLTAPRAPWSGTRRHLDEDVVVPHRPPHRSPDPVVIAGPGADTPVSPD